MRTLNQRLLLATVTLAAVAAGYLQLRPGFPLPVEHLDARFSTHLAKYPAAVTGQAEVSRTTGVVTASAVDEESRDGRPGVRREKRRFDSPGDAARFRYQRQVDETGQIPDGALMRAKAQVDGMRAAQPFRPNAAGITRGSWTWLGPGNIGGRIRAVAIHPSVTSTLFIGSVSGGIWKSTNSGTSWSVVDDFMANLAVTSIVIQPGTPSTMYAATGEGFSNFDNIRGAGIFKSTDSGVTWTQLAATANSNFNYVTRLAMSADGLTLLATTSVGLYRSIDAGNTFTRTLQVSTFGSGLNASIVDVKFLTGSSTHAVASGYSTNAYFTTNGGATWTAATGLTAAGTFIRVEIGVGGASAPDTVYLVVDGPTTRVWKSTNGGAAYTLAAGNPNHLGGQGWYDNVVWVDPTDALRVVVGGTQLSATTDGGATWTTRSYGAGIHPDHHAIVHDPGYNGTTNKRVYMGNDGGIYKTEDMAVSPFTSVAFTALNNNLGITQFYGAAGNVSSGKIYGGTQDNGTLLYTPGGGTNWTMRVGGDGGYGAADPNDPNYLYGEYQWLGIHRNTSGGTSSSDEIYGWSDSLGGCKPAPYQITDACLSTPTTMFIAPFILDPNNANTMLAGGRSLWRTTDVKTANTASTGPTWAAIKAPVSTNNITAIAVAPGNSDIVWVGHDAGPVFKAVNGTAATPTWVSQANGTPARRVLSIAIDPANINTVYASFGGFSTTNLWKTINGGTSWTSASGSGVTGLPSAPIYSVAVHPTIASWVYAGTEVGLFASTDGGATWSLPHDGPANVSVDELFWMGGTLVAVTHGRGVYTQSTGSNSPPTATAVSITGTLAVGQLLTGNYTYSDADGDGQGASTFRWLRNGSTIAGATASTYTTVVADNGTTLIFEVTPVALTGLSPGPPVTSNGVVLGNSAPTASAVSITGSLVVGQVLTGQYTYADADNDLQGASTFRWLRGGTAITSAIANTYTVAVADAAQTITFEVTPKAATGTIAGTPVTSSGVVIANLAPTITQHPASATRAAGATASFTAAASGAPVPAVQWQVSTNAGSTFANVSGATSATYSFTAAVNDHSRQYRAVFTNVAGSATSNAATLTVPGNLTATPSSLRFGATASGAAIQSVTAAQTVTVTFTGGAGAWAAASNQPWLHIAGGAGSAAGSFSVQVIAGSVPAGATSVAATITVTGGTGAPLSIPVTLTVTQSTAAAVPFGGFDTPGAGASVEGSIAVTGWALDDIEVTRVEIWRDLVAGETTPPYPGPGLGTGKVFIANAFFVNGARPDIESAPAYAAYPFAYRAGWGYLLLTQGLWNQGNGAFTLHAFAYDRDGRSTSLGSKAITVNNNAAVKPFGALDTPTYGQTVSGAFYNFGWALTPNATPTCTIGPAQVQMAIDSGTLLPVPYGDLRTDIAGAFPGFTNGGGAGGAYYLDTTTLTNGVHQIGWFVTDSCGRAEGVGSRFFTVLNGSADAPVRAADNTDVAQPVGPAKAGHHISDVASANVASGFSRTIGDAVEVRRAFDTTLVHPGLAGDRVVAIGQSDRVEVVLPPANGARYTGYQVVRGQRKALPLGSSLDGKQGIFYWQPAAGFLGSFDLEFVAGAAGAPVRVRAVVGTAVQAVIDTPTTGDGDAVDQPFTIAGWAVDLAATSGSGIDTVHVWAHPTDGASPIFLGVADYGDARLDIGALFGEQFTGASFNLSVDGLAPGTYDVVIYPHSAVTGDFRGAQVVRVRVP